MLSRRESWCLLGSVWGASLLFLMGLTLADPDLWGHTLYGIRAIDRGILTERSDPFSYTADGAAWVNHEWLTEWQFGWLWTHIGNRGLVAWRNAWVLALWLVVACSFWKHRCGLGAGLLILVLAAECLSDFVVFVRPQLATFGLFALHLWLLRQVWDNPKNRWGWVLPPLMSLWVNLHGGFLAGLGVQAVFLVASAFGLRQPIGWQRLQLFAGVFLCSSLATLLNPWGWGLHEMLWHHLWTP
ncbi:MAG: hypothetical protein KDA84_03345, partial [Planctomycetaceae bacterium]|nr:hypothetical protein [Planctomycetaceae bacterium]